MGRSYFDHFDSNLMGNCYHLLPVDVIIMVSKNCPYIAKDATIIFVTPCVALETAWPPKRHLLFLFQIRHGETFSQFREFCKAGQDAMFDTVLQQFYECGSELPQINCLNFKVGSIMFQNDNNVFDWL